MSSFLSRRRRALRAAATSAAVAAAVLGPAAGAFAAPAAGPGGGAASVAGPTGGASSVAGHEAAGRDAGAAGSGTSTGKAADQATAKAADHPSAAKAADRPSAAKPVPSRYAGRPVYLGNGYLAVLRNDPSAGGPEAWIRYVGPHWKPGDTYMVRVMDVLNRTHRTAHLGGLTLRLLDATGAAPTLQVTGPQGTRTYALPRSAKPGAEPAGRPKDCTATKRQDIGAGTMAVLTNGPKGPRVTFEAAGDPSERLPYVLDREHPVIPEKAGFVAKIVDAYGPRPKLITNMEGGGHPAMTTSFPQAPQGCSLPVGKVPAHGAKAATGTATGTAARTAATGHQTTLVPKGAVAAGAEGVGDSDHTLVVAGGALASAGAAGVAFAVLRRRRDAGRQV
ncbi:hypothetical protein ADL22_17850 [Streptomyces sp. NRRL F-4489]|uniref:hypothetical protein n=1 Tax=Streptomyces sp. NRRL F-4489 TaxID=1609095 RepID=UPI000748C910|nr:hypothetical protein [Streptomyces sp. NRRL F-4489]KUL38631.1 hypothetical protein ADL22_17850 [Streptomyces sp. NRRL F-4489]